MEASVVSIRIPLGLDPKSEHRLQRAIKTVEAVLASRVESRIDGRITFEAMIDKGQVTLAIVEDRTMIR